VSVSHEIAAWQLACANRVPFCFRGLGSSMLPALRPGDEALFEPLADLPPRRGDVLLYRAGDRLVAHRLLAADADGHLRLRGDALAADDPPVPAAAVLGRLVAIRRGRRELRADRAPLAWYAAVLPELARLTRHAPHTDRVLRRALRLCMRVAARLTPHALGG